MATVEQAEHMEQMVTADVSRASARLTAQVATNSLRTALSALQDAAHRLRSSRPQRGEVTLQSFARVAGERDVVGLDAREITREVKRELARHGVLFSVEKGANGQSWVHVQAKDAKLIAHALERAEEALDRRIARREARAEAAVKIKERAAEIREERSQEREHKRERDRDVPERDKPEAPDRSARTR